ncbi:GGDEF domain-containing phosphodiesterase [Novosphingobium sp. RD2P27]|uniref:GGDEF domain-containing phosphodiesterase n=1 Tax=Novosphingobium kalidii TaxID=3230299 RepID=A0ABV2CXD7_9SPHN
MKWDGQARSDTPAFVASTSDWLDPRECAEVVDGALRALPQEKHLGLLFLEVRGLSEQLDLLLSSGESSPLHTVVSLAAALPPCTRMARLGRETLALIFPSLTSLAEAERLAQAVASGPLLIGGTWAPPVPLDTRSGLAVAPGHGQSFNTLLARAELAVIELRRQNASSFATYRSDFHTRALRRRRLRQDLERAEEEGQFELFYQPQIDLSTGRTIGMEALLRWRHPAYGLLPPNGFLAELEQMPQAKRVDKWVLQAATAQAAAWSGAQPLRVAINIFPDRLGPELVQDVERALDAHHLAPEALEIEITERHALDDLDGAASTVRSLRNLGVSVALDDFGTGFASLSAISALDVNRLKIDRSFVSDMLTNGKSVAIIATLIELGRRIEMSILAEGIETAEQRDLLHAFGCNEGQGYLFGKPGPPELLWPTGVSPAAAVPHAETCTGPA